MGPLQGDEASARTAGPVVSRTREVDAAPRSVLRTFDGPTAFWSGPEEPTVATAGVAARTTAAGPGRFAAVRETATELFETVDADGPAAARPRLFGGFAFHDDHRAAPPWDQFPAAHFVLPAVQVTRTGDATYLTATVHGPDADAAAADRLDEAAERLSEAPDPGPPGDPPGVVGQSLTTPRDAWGEQVTAAVERIRAGDLRKVALAGALRADLGAPASVPDVLARLRSAYPDCYRFAVAPEGGATFFGATPERLVSLRGRAVRTGALAGTAARGDTEAEDERLARALRASEKDDEEHQLVVEAIRDQVAPVAKSLSTGDRVVRTLANVQHLYTPIEASLSGDGHVLSLVERLHPTPAVGGRPPEAALDAIRELETLSAEGEAGRGWYAAPVGWLDADGDGTFAVAIRSGVTEGRVATLFAGNGIVADSDPGEEWDEVLPKYRPVLGALE